MGRAWPNRLSVSNMGLNGPTINGLCLYRLMGLHLSPNTVHDGPCQSGHDYYSVVACQNSRVLCRSIQHDPSGHLYSRLFYALKVVSRESLWLPPLRKTLYFSYSKCKTNSCYFLSKKKQSNELMHVGISARLPRLLGYIWYVWFSYKQRATVRFVLMQKITQFIKINYVPLLLFSPTQPFIQDLDHKLI